MSNQVEFVNKGHHPLPSYATDQSAGLDVRAYLPEGSVWLEPGQRKLIPTGLYMALPVGYEAQIRPRSGLALKHGLTVLNSPGTVDADYRGEVGVLLINHGELSFEVKDGERIAQMVIARYSKVVLNQVEKLGDSERGSGGFGSTGVN